jgi:glyoxylase-like metal-dependent hydrolase (beta-lactamase superfamily II)
MRIYTYSLGELQANCYLLENDGKGILIDPADDGSFLLEEIQRKNITLEGIYLTHGHFDHCMAAGEIQLAYEGLVETQNLASLPIYMSKHDQFLIDRLESTAKHFLGHTPIMVPPKTVNFIEPRTWNMEQEEKKVLRSTFQVLASPGHTPGGLCYYFPDEAALFTGDTLFADAVGRTDLSYSSKADLWASLKTILALPEETTVYPGHGESTYIGEQKYLLG